MIKKLFKYGKIAVALTLIMALTLPSYATVGASDGSAFVTKAEFDAALSDFNARLMTFEAGINSKIDSQVSSYLDRNGIWNGKAQEVVYDERCGYLTMWDWWDIFDHVVFDKDELKPKNDGFIALSKDDFASPIRWDEPTAAKDYLWVPVSYGSADGGSRWSSYSSKKINFQRALKDMEYDAIIAPWPIKTLTKDWVPTINKTGLLFAPLQVRVSTGNSLTTSYALNPYRSPSWVTNVDTLEKAYNFLARTSWCGTPSFNLCCMSEPAASGFYTVQGKVRIQAVRYRSGSVDGDILYQQDIMSVRPSANGFGVRMMWLGCDGLNTDLQVGQFLAFVNKGDTIKWQIVFDATDKSTWDSSSVPRFVPVIGWGPYSTIREDLVSGRRYSGAFAFALAARDVSVY